MVLLTPFNQGTHLLSVAHLIVVSDQAYHRCVISKFARTFQSDTCLSAIDPQSPVHFTSVSALYSVQCGSFNHALARLKRLLRCIRYLCSVIALIYYFCMCYCYHCDSKILYYYLDITLFNSLNLSTFRFRMGLVLILLMNMYCSL